MFTQRLTAVVTAMQTETKILGTTPELGTIADLERVLGRRLIVRAAVNLLLVGGGCLGLLLRAA